MTPAANPLQRWLHTASRQIFWLRARLILAAALALLGLALGTLAWLPTEQVPAARYLLGLGLSVVTTVVLLLWWARPGGRETTDLLETAGLLRAEAATGLRLAQGGQALGSPAAAKLAQSRVEKLLPKRLELQGIGRRSQRWALGLFLVGLALMVPAIRSLDDRWPELQEHLQSQAAAEDRPVLARVSDLDITLKYPAYLQREDLLLKGSDGDLEMPAGTRVQLRAQPNAPGPVTQAAVLLEGHRVGLEVLADGQVEGEFLVRRSGRYRLALTVGEQELVEAQGHQLSVIPDEAPKVERLFPKDRVELDVPGVVEYLFSAEDDHGLAGIFLVYRLEGEADEQRRDLVGADGVKSLKRQGELKLDALGMTPGDVLHWCIEVEDNNDITGPSRGRSAWHEVRIFDPSGRAEELLDRLENLIGTLTDQLALLLIRQKKPGEWSSGLSPVLTKAGSLVTDLGDRRLDLGEFARALKEIVARLDKARRGYAAGRRSHQAMEDRLERDLLYLDDLLSKRRLRQISEYQRQLAQERAALARMMKAYKDSPNDGQLRQQILASIQGMRRRLEKLAARMAKLQRKVGRQHVNADALKEKNLGGDLDRLEELVRAGKVDEAMAALDEMARSLGDLSEQVDQAAKQFGGKEWRELKEKAGEIQQEIAWLKDNQNRSRSQLSRIRRVQDQRRLKAMGGEMKKWRKGLQEKLAEARGALEQIPHGSSWFKDLKQQAQTALNRTDDALAGDALPEAKEAAEDARGAIERLDWALDNITDAKEQRRAKKNKAKADQLTAEVLAELERLLNQAGGANRGERQAMEGLAKKQEELNQRMEGLAGKMAELNQMAPVVGGEARSALEKAQGSSAQAGRSLRQGQGLPADGHQGQVLESLEDLAQQLKASGGSGGGQGMMNPFGQGKGKGGDKKGPQGKPGSRERVAIPKGEGFQVPGAWREEILEAWREGAPGDHKESVDEYYKELVR